MSKSLYVLSVGGVKKKGPLFLKQAQMRGLKVWMIDSAKNLEQAPDAVKIADRVSAIEFRDLEICREWAKDHAGQEDIIGVFALSEFTVESAAAIADVLRLPGNPPEVAHTIRNKHLCRQALRERGFRQPAGALCHTLQEAQHFAETHGPGPWIVKPPDEGGSSGVSLVRDEQDWKAALQRLGYTLPAPFLIECFQTGEEFSAEGVFVAGKPQVLTITTKVTTQAPYFIELGHSMPAELSPEMNQRIRETVSAGLLAVGMRWGVFHVEFWVDGDQVVLGELHGRSGGGKIHPMTELTTGLDMYGVALDELLQKAINPTEWNLTRQGTAIREFDLPSGRVTAIRGLERVKADPACLEVMCKLQVGDECISTNSSLNINPYGYVLATGKTGKEADENAERLYRYIHIEFEKAEVASNR